MIADVRLFAKVYDDREPLYSGQVQLQPPRVVAARHGGIEQPLAVALYRELHVTTLLHARVNSHTRLEPPHSLAQSIGHFGAAADRQSSFELGDMPLALIVTMSQAELAAQKRQVAPRLMKLHELRQFDPRRQIRRPFDGFRLQLAEMRKLAGGKIEPLQRRPRTSQFQSADSRDLHVLAVQRHRSRHKPRASAVMHATERG